jgi:hypothetical protein
LRCSLVALKQGGWIDLAQQARFHFGFLVLAKRAQIVPNYNTTFGWKRYFAGAKWQFLYKSCLVINGFQPRLNMSFSIKLLLKPGQRWNSKPQKNAGDWMRNAASKNVSGGLVCFVIAAKLRLTHGARNASAASRGATTYRSSTSTSSIGLISNHESPKSFAHAVGASASNLQRVG